MRNWLVVAWLAIIPGSGWTQTLADEISGCEGNPPEQTIDATPANYRSLLTGLLPGDRLRLAAGTYTQGLPVTDLHGEPGRCIVMEGPATGTALFTGRDCCNTVAITDSSYVVVRHLSLDGQDRFVDAVKAESPSASAHHVTIEDLVITGHGVDQQVVGISTKCPTWNWVIRRNVIEGAGTGLYLGNSDGSAEFVNGLIEHNLVRDTVGYGMEIKHQLTRDTGLGEPASGRTVIRHNVFSKASGASTGASARPNVLVGHWPLSGNGSSDVYEVYGNVFHQNPVEALFQGEGNVALYDNLFVRDVNPGFPSVAIQPHNDVPRAIEVFHNTVVGPGTGIRVTGGDTGFLQRVRGNVVFAGTPFSGGTQSANVSGAYAAASSFLNDPFAPIGAGLDLYPLAGTVTGAALDPAGLTGFRDWDRDFDGTPRDLTFRGAYSGEGTNPGWPVALDRKPEPAPPPPVSVSVANLTVSEGAGPATFTVTLSPASASPVTVAWSTDVTGSAASGLDYTATAGTVTFAPGIVTAEALVPLANDTLDEGAETFHVDLGAVSGATVADGRAQGTIADDDPLPVLSIADRAFTEGDSGTALAGFTVTLSPPSGRTVLAAWATATAGTATSGADYDPAAGTLTFAPGITSRVAKVPVRGDLADEPEEIYYVDLGTPTFATRADTRGKGTIVDDDPAPPGSPALSVTDVTVGEGDSGTVNARFTVTLSASPALTALVSYATADGTATATSDYTARSGTLTFSPGQTAKTVAVSVQGDLVDEGSETFFLDLTKPVNATLADGRGRTTIADDDP